jgi:hypothetical protein
LKKEANSVIEKIVPHLCAKLIDPCKSEKAFYKLIELNITRIFSLLKLIIDPQTDFKNVVKYNVIYSDI